MAAIRAAPQPPAAAGGGRSAVLAAGALVVGACCLAVLAFGLADPDVTHVLLLLGACLALVAGSLFVGTGAPTKAGSGAGEVATPKGGSSMAPSLSIPLPRVPQTDLSEADAGLPTARPPADKADLPETHGAEHADDCVWEADWANLDRSAKPDDGEEEMMMRATTSVEVFELNGTPTWLARLQQRRHQAARAGKEKLAQKLEKEIAEARRAHAVEREQTEAAEQPGAREEAHSADGPRCASEDVYGFDWAAIDTERPPPQVA